MWVKGVKKRMWGGRCEEGGVERVVCGKGDFQVNKK